MIDGSLAVGHKIMSKCSGCGCELPWPLKTCGKCGQEFFQGLGKSAAGPIKLAHCSKCGKLKMCSESGYEWVCEVCKAELPAVSSQPSNVDAPSVRVQSDNVAVAVHPKQTEQKIREVDTVRPPRTSLLRWFDSDMRQRVIAYRIQECLEASSSRIGLRELKQRLHASRYRDWQAAFNWLAGAGVLKLEGRVVVLVKSVTLRLPPRRRKPRRKQTDRPRTVPTEWFERHREVYGQHWKSDPELRA